MPLCALLNKGCRLHYELLKHLANDSREATESAWAGCEDGNGAPHEGKQLPAPLNQTPHEAVLTQGEPASHCRGAPARECKIS